MEAEVSWNIPHLSSSTRVILLTCRLAIWWTRARETIPQKSHCCYSLMNLNTTKIPSVSAERPGIKHTPSVHRLILKLRPAMAYSSLDSLACMFSHLVCVASQSTRDTPVLHFLYHFAFYQKKKQKNIDVVYITDKNHQYSVWNNFAVNRMNPMPIPPLEQPPLYTVYFTYL